MFGTPYFPVSCRLFTAVCHFGSAIWCNFYRHFVSFIAIVMFADKLTKKYFSRCLVAGKRIFRMFFGRFVKNARQKFTAGAFTMVLFFAYFF